MKSQCPCRPWWAFDIWRGLFEAAWLPRPGWWLGCTTEGTSRGSLERDQLLMPAVAHASGVGHVFVCVCVRVGWAIDLCGEVSCRNQPLLSCLVLSLIWISLVVQRTQRPPKEMSPVEPTAFAAQLISRLERLSGNRKPWAPWRRDFNRFRRLVLLEAYGNVVSVSNRTFYKLLPLKEFREKYIYMHNIRRIFWAGCLQ